MVKFSQRSRYKQFLTLQKATESQLRRLSKLAVT